MALPIMNHERRPFGSRLSLCSFTSSYPMTVMGASSQGWTNASSGFVRPVMVHLSHMSLPRQVPSNFHVAEQTEIVVHGDPPRAVAALDMFSVKREGHKTNRAE